MNVLSRAYVDGMYEDYQKDPSAFSTEWQTYFESFGSHSNGTSNGSQNGSSTGKRSATVTSDSPSRNSNGTHAVKSSTSRVVARENAAERIVAAAHGVSQTGSELSVAQMQDRVDQLIRSYRVRGHLAAKFDPLGMPRADQPELEVHSYGLLPSDLTHKFSTRTMNGVNVRTLEEIVDSMKATYCRYIGAQFMHIDDHEVRDWLQQRMEGTENRIRLSRDSQLRILTRLTDAVIFEEFVRRKFVGAKTFSLEGAESVIPLLDMALEKAGSQNVQDVVIGMAHRGRLNVLANIMGKRGENIFWSFDDPNPEISRGGGDVLYHLGYSSDWKTAAGKHIHLSLCFNPSHLEFVNPVAIGRCRAKQDRRKENDDSVMTILIHGDAAFAGEGIVQETLNMSELPAYTVGGTLHVIINNQIGFTTPAREARSTTYASDVAKMLQIPIFHVNGEDPEAVAQVVELAMEFRNKFKRDVVIDMYCYRRLGHNESDEPRFTQPLMYKKIDSRPTVRDSYMQSLFEMNEVSKEEADKIAENRKQKLQAQFDAAKKAQFESDQQTLDGFWKGYYGGLELDDDDVDTSYDQNSLGQMIQDFSTIETGFAFNRKLERLFDNRRKMGKGEVDVDWATAELAAFATLSVAGHRVRLSGQDCGRGTFSQRHAVVHEIETGARRNVLHNLTADQADVDIINSPLCETGVLGFEYGYSLDYPDGLICWEAQFGDFWNCAQVIVDQFITSAEDKWGRLSGLTMLLPHGFEGAGPEHCSARVERFLLLAAEHNIQIANPTTAAQHFHLLRRQVLRKWRKPLVVLTPKSLLRDPMVASPLENFSEGTFKRILNDPILDNGEVPKRILMCTGKVGVELIKERERTESKGTAIVRIEQLYPLATSELEKIFAHLPNGYQIHWVQEEPANMGAWQFMRFQFGDKLFNRLPLIRVSRPESASPSTGSKKMHKIEQQELYDQALAVQQK